MRWNTQLGKSYRADEVIHVMGSTSNGFIGYSTLETNRRLFEIALNTQMFAKTYFENGGFMSGIVKASSIVVGFSL